MATAHTVVTGSTSNAPPIGSVFTGLKFFLVRRLPSRGRFVADIEANGGIVTAHEAKADYIIADHVRKDAPPGSHSYTLVESAIRNATFPDDVAEYAINAPSAAQRPAGSVRPHKNTRQPYTAEEDRLLWEFVQTEVNTKGALEKGNTIYQRFAEGHTTHTWQSWRDHYIKQLMDKPPAGAKILVAANASPSPPNSSLDDAEVVPNPFTQSELEFLLLNAADAENIDDDRKPEAWAAWAEAFPTHTAEEWEEAFVKQVRPIFLSRQEAEQKAKKEAGREAGTDEDFEEEEEDDEQEDENDEEEEAAVQPTQQAAWISRHRGEQSFAGEEDQNIATRKRKRVSPATTSPIKRRAALAEADNEARRLSHNSVSPVQALPGSRIDESSTSQSNKTNGSKAIEHDMGSGTPNTIYKWTAEEDEILLQATSRGLNATQISEHLSKNKIRSSNAVRNRRAFLKIRQRSVDDHATVKSKEQARSSDYVTSDVNHAADLQLQDENARAIFSEGRDSEVAPVDQLEYWSQHSGSYRTAELDQAAMDHSSPASSDEDDIGDATVILDELERESGRPALTEANLASQQDQHKSKLPRGVDLDEDESVEDLTEFATYLKNLLPERSSDRISELGPNNDKPGTSPIQPDQTASRSGPQSGLPLSWEQEISDVVNADLMWPVSPQQQHGRTAGLEDQTRPQPNERDIEDAVSSPDWVASSEHVPEDQVRPQPNEHDIEDAVSSPDWLPSSERVSDSEEIHDDAEATQSDDMDGSEPEISVLGHDIDPNLENFDFGLVEPEGGFGFAPSIPGSMPDSSFGRIELIGNGSRQPIDISSAGLTSSPYNSSRHSSILSQVREEVLGAESYVVETQDIFNAATQVPDLRPPLPPSPSWDGEQEAEEASVATATPRPKGKRAEYSSSDEESEKDDDETDLDSWISTMKVRGFPEDAIHRALKRTSCRTELALIVLMMEKAETGFPDDVPGIWSEREDRYLEGTNATALRRLEEKHSAEECEARMKWLQVYREEDDDE